MTPQYFRIFRWHLLRYLRRHPLLGVLNILSVALGVAVYLATQIANHSTNRGFAATIDLAAGKAELQITAPGGQLPETALPRVAAAPGISAATPIVHGLMILPDFPANISRFSGAVCRWSGRKAGDIFSACFQLRSRFFNYGIPQYRKSGIKLADAGKAVEHPFLLPFDPRI